MRRRALSAEPEGREKAPTWLKTAARDDDPPQAPWVASAVPLEL